MMMRSLFLIALSLLLLSCSNVLDDIAKKDTEDAIFYEAQLKLNQSKYSEAIELLESLNPLFLAKREVRVIHASAYAGSCGLNFVNTVLEMDNFNGDDSLFLPMMQIYPGGTDAKLAHCVRSEEILSEIGAATDRNNDENILMGFLSFTKIGTILSRFADVDGDGNVDASFDHCDPDRLPEDAVREIGTGLAHTITSVAAVGSDLAGGAVTSITNFCLMAPQLNGFCETTNKSDFSTMEVSVLRAVIGSAEQGLGTCPGDYTTCLCP